ncbi:MAG: dihydropteroate synthase [Vicinamibacterales bacterium]
MFPTRRSYLVPLPDGSHLSLGERPLVMGVLNVTPDSFADAERLDTARAVETALAMEAAGADIIDLGGESTRPGAVPVDADEELRRVLPVLKALAGRLRVPVSIDTYKAVVARAAVAEGASIVNDISGLTYDPGMARAVAETRASLVLMHTRGRSADMYALASYDDVVAEVGAELRGGLDAAVAAGVALERIVIDPGIGFAKRPMHSYGLLARIAELSATLDRPILAGPSRKSFMREALDDRPPSERDWGTAAAVTAAVLGGAHIVRVHAVTEMVQVVRVAEATRRHGRIDNGPMTS